MNSFSKDLQIRKKKCFLHVRFLLYNNVNIYCALIFLPVMKMDVDIRSNYSMSGNKHYLN